MKKIPIKRPLSVALQSVDFNQGDTDGSDSSLMVAPWTASWIRENFSYATYSIADAKAAAEQNTLRVWARFLKSEPGGSIQIRTVQVLPPAPRNFTDLIFKNFEGKDALGVIEPKRIFFGDTGQSVFRGKYSNVPMYISGSKFPELGVGIYDIMWRWEYRTIVEETDDETIWSDTWIPLETSKHRVFVTLDKPTAPWTHDPRTLLKTKDIPLWSEALFIACNYAYGSKTPEEVGKKIADALFYSKRFEYMSTSSYSNELEEVGENGSSVKVTEFYMFKAIERMMGGNGLGDYANCTDCALMVTVLTNALGGNLRIGKLQNSENTDYADPDIVIDNRFEINEIRAIGKDVETTMSALEDDGKHYFSYHCVAWQPGVTNDPENPKFEHSDNLIYDGCVHFVNDENDGKKVPPSASGEVLGKKGAKSGYRSRLAAATRKGVSHCKAQELTVSEIRVVWKV